MVADDVQLPDLEVIQRYSLAVRGATAPRADVIAALQADLDWLTGAASAPAPQRGSTSPTTTRAPAKAAKTPKRAARTSSAKRSTSTPTSEA